MKTAVNYSAYYRDVMYICLMTSNFIFMKLNGVTSFSRIGNLRIICERLYYSQSFGEISFHVMAENWQHLKGTLPIRHFYVLESK